MDYPRHLPISRQSSIQRGRQIETGTGTTYNASDTSTYRYPDPSQPFRYDKYNSTAFHEYPKAYYTPRQEEYQSSNRLEHFEWDPLPFKPAPKLQQFKHPSFVFPERSSEEKVEEYISERKLRNREAAKRSRDRKRVELEGLYKELKQLREENEQLKVQNEDLMSQLKQFQCNILEESKE